jgi:hypothetical protein
MAESNHLHAAVTDAELLDLSKMTGIPASLYLIHSAVAVGRVGDAFPAILMPAERYDLAYRCGRIYFVGVHLRTQRRVALPIFTDATNIELRTHHHLTRSEFATHNLFSSIRDNGETSTQDRLPTLPYHRLSSKVSR